MPEPAELDTRAHVLRAVAGNQDSLGWLVDRVTPLLLAQARVRIGAELRRVIEPQDLVQEVWAIALPKIGSLRERERLDPRMLVAFLARILIYRCNDLLRKHILGKPRRQGSTSGMLRRLSGRESGAVTRAVRNEARGAVESAIAGLDEVDRKIVVLRGIERDPVQQIAVVLGVSDNLVSVRYRRALDKLRRVLPAEVGELLADE